MRNNNTNKAVPTAVIETLEARQLMSGTPLTIAQVAVNGGTQLQITGTNGNDKITLNQTAAGLVIGNTGGWSATVAGSFATIRVATGNGNDSVVESPSVATNTTIIGGVGSDNFQAGSGNDTLYGGTGTNILNGGAGNNTYVTIGSAADSIYGGAGKESFWTDNSAAEKIFNLRADEVAYGAVHRVSNFYGSTPAATAATKSAKTAHSSKKTSKTSTSAPLAEPAVTTKGLTYTNFSSQPLFASNGPTQDDIRQGYVGDCYFLSTLAAVAKVDPMKIEQSVVQLADGTYVVQFNQKGQQVFVHVDGSLPTWSWGQPAYAGLGTQGSMWVAVMEKAFATVRTGANSYASINSGWMSEAFGDLGIASQDFDNATNAAQLASVLQSQLALGKAVTYATNTAAPGAPLISGHAYEVVSVVTDNTGKVTGIVMRNPWGIDGAGHDSNPNDGYVTVTPQQAYGSYLGVVAAFA